MSNVGLVKKDRVKTIWKKKEFLPDYLGENLVVSSHAQLRTYAYSRTGKKKDDRWNDLDIKLRVFDGRDEIVLASYVNEPAEYRRVQNRLQALITHVQEFSMALEVAFSMYHSDQTLIAAEIEAKANKKKGKK